jgi:hypothetical protein
MLNLSQIMDRYDSVTVVRRVAEVCLHAGSVYSTVGFPYPISKECLRVCYLVAYIDYGQVYFCYAYTTKRVSQMIDKAMREDAKLCRHRTAFRRRPTPENKALSTFKNMVFLKRSECRILEEVPDILLRLPRYGAFIVHTFNRKRKLYLDKQDMYYALKFWTRHLLAETLQCLM